MQASSARGRLPFLRAPFRVGGTVCWSAAYSLSPSCASSLAQCFPDKFFGGAGTLDTFVDETSRIAGEAPPPSVTSDTHHERCSKAVWPCSPYKPAFLTSHGPLAHCRGLFQACAVHGAFQKNAGLSAPCPYSTCTRRQCHCCGPVHRCNGHVAGNALAVHVLRQVCNTVYARALCSLSAWARSSNLQVGASATHKQMRTCVLPPAHTLSLFSPH
jgi:hypothetical protein